MTDPKVILRQGNRYLDISSGRYKPMVFVPPSAVLTPLLAGGTSANRYGGSAKLGERANDRQWTFTVRVRGASEAECEAAGMILGNFLALATRNNPVYLDYRGNSDIATEPLWGQYGASHRFEITHADPPAVWENYLLGSLRERAIVYGVTVTIKPFQAGKRQRLMSASGSIAEDTIGAGTGRSRGVTVGKLTTNKMTNPVFGNSTWNTGWTAAANITASRNVDTQYILWGQNSAKLISRGSTNHTFTMSIDAGNTNTHYVTAYVRKPTGATITPGEFNINYNGTSYPTDVKSLGNGWYRLGQSVTGIAAPTAIGLDVSIDETVYLAGMQFEELNVPSHLVFGDMLGCAWGSTAHNSETSTTAGVLRLSVAGDNFNVARGSFRIIWRAPMWNITATLTLIDDNQTGFKLDYIGASNVFRFSDGANNVDSATFIPPEDGTTPTVLHCTWSETGITLTVNGTRTTNSAFTIPTLPTYIYIGSTAASTGFCDGSIMDFGIYDHVITAAEALADYNNIKQSADELDRIGAIPYFWTKDGDDQLDNCNDSSRDNFAIVGGVPGDYPAETLIGAATSSNFNTFGSAYLSNLPMDVFYSPSSMVFADQSGTADVGNSSGDAFKRTNLSTTEASLSANFLVSRSENLDPLLDRNFVFLCRIADAGSNLQLKTRYSVSGNVDSEFKAVTGSATAYLFETNPLFLPSNRRLFRDDKVSSQTITFVLRGKRSSGSAANVDVDYANIFPYPYIKITGGDSSDLGFMYRSVQNQAVGIGATSVPDNIGALTNLAMQVYGPGPIEFIPSKLNLFQQLLGDATHAPTITYTATYYVYVTPRWALL